MIPAYFAVVAGVISFFGPLPYIRDILKGKAKPNIATWSTWGVISAVVTAAAISDGAYESAILTGANAIALWFVVILGLKKGTRRYTLLDVICQIIALAGLVLWQTLDAAYIAIAFGVLADTIASLPTIRHSYAHPHEETWQAYAIGGFAAFLSLLATQAYFFSSVAFPLTLLLSNALIVTVILVRRNAGLKTPNEA